MARIEERIRLNKFIAKSGIYSRRQADLLIFNGLVKINGKFIQDPSVKVNPETDIITVNDVKLNIDKEIFIKFYKPVNVLSSYISQGCKRSLIDFEPFNKFRLSYAGRLDYKSEGLMFFCNDGDLIERLLLPENHVEKEYLVYVDHCLSEKDMMMLQKGLTIGDVHYKECKIIRSGKLMYKVLIHEGKKRQIRKMFKYCNVNVIKLIRVRIGPILLGDLKPGEYKNLDIHELRGIKNV
jgi:pseudouridine synthase